MVHVETKTPFSFSRKTKISENSLTFRKISFHKNFRFCESFCGNFRQKRNKFFAEFSRKYENESFPSNPNGSTTIFVAISLNHRKKVGRLGWGGRGPLFKKNLSMNLVFAKHEFVFLLDIQMSLNLCLDPSKYDK
jgi:hypothetical protein